MLNNEEIEKLIEDMTKVRPEMLNEDGLKLFNTIMKIADERDELKLKCKELKEIEESHRKENGKLRERVKQLEEENRIFALEGSKVRLQIHIENNYIPKLKLKEFFSSRLEKYQEADDGRYEQEYLTRGELELVDRYKECKEIAEIILKQEVKNEIPQDCIPKSVIKEKIEELNKNGYWNYLEERDLETTINILQELLEKRG